MTRRGGAITFVGAAALALLAGCTPPALPSFAPTSAPAPKARPVIVPVKASPAAVAPARMGDVLVSRYRRMQDSYVARGLMRTDGGGPDTPFTSAMLARDFLSIALYDEFRRSSSGIRAAATETQLRRWDGPVRMAVHFGGSVPHDRRTQDRNELISYTARLARVTGADIAMGAPEAANFHVLFLNEAELAEAGPMLRSLARDLDPAVLAKLTALPRDTLCVVTAHAGRSAPGFTGAIAVIRDEHRGLMRRACIHEEIAQGLGLTNDSPHARPSIFNDDQEFALLTHHDELLLKMLYDPRLRSGMSLDEVTPIARRIARELVEGDR